VLVANKTYTATIKTSKGDIVIQLDTKSSPSFTNSFVFLAENGFYNGLTFLKVERLNQISPETNQISNIDLIQGGKGGDAQAGPGYTLKPDSTKGTYALGVVAMANPSQFFINTADNSQAITSTSYPIIGTVTSGLTVAKAITRGDKIISITITSKTVVPTPTATSAPTSPPATVAPTTAPASPTAVSGNSAAVTIQSFAFHPQVITVKVGTTITWTDKDSFAHTVTSVSGPTSFNSGDLTPSGGTFQFKFSQAGTYNYHCMIHPSMTATVIVVS